MSLQSLSYSEFKGEPKYWVLSDAIFSNINLIVGKNASGKSRLVSIINAFAESLSGKRSVPYETCKFSAVILLNDKRFSYDVEFSHSGVVHEKLDIDGIEKLIRDKNGDGEIYYEKEEKKLTFQLPKDVLAIVNRRDKIQHPYLMELNEWANSVVLYLFGSDFGRSGLLGIPEADKLINNPNRPISHDPANLVKVYTSAFNKFGEKFNKVIIEDMNKLGYSLSKVGCDNPRIPNISIPVLGMYIVEEDLKFNIFQIHLSQGMFRAMALIVHLNLCAFSNKKKLIIVDDIGEGLDYERSVAIIDLLITKTKENNIQLIMTSNDRFVMNKVPLEHWSVLQRKGGIVKMFNKENSSKTFEDFQYLGLSNFDFFTSDFFRSEVDGD